MFWVCTVVSMRFNFGRVFSVVSVVEETKLYTSLRGPILGGLVLCRN